jgi:hypothetical protein
MLWFVLSITSYESPFQTEFQSTKNMTVSRISSDAISFREPEFESNANCGIMSADRHSIHLLSPFKVWSKWNVQQIANERPAKRSDIPFVFAHPRPNLRCIIAYAYDDLFCLQRSANVGWNPNLNRWEISTSWQLSSYILFPFIRSNFNSGCGITSAHSDSFYLHFSIKAGPWLNFSLGKTEMSGEALDHCRSMSKSDSSLWLWNDVSTPRFVLSVAFDKSPFKIIQTINRNQTLGKNLDHSISIRKFSSELQLWNHKCTPQFGSYFVSNECLSKTQSMKCIQAFQNANLSHFHSRILLFILFGTCGLPNRDHCFKTKRTANGQDILGKSNANPSCERGYAYPGLFCPRSSITAGSRPSLNKWTISNSWKMTYLTCLPQSKSMESNT